MDIIEVGLRKNKTGVKAWTPEENALFREGILKHGKDYTKIQNMVQTKTRREIQGMAFCVKIRLLKDKEHPDHELLPILLQKMRKRDYFIKHPCLRTPKNRHNLTDKNGKLISAEDKEKMFWDEIVDQGIDSRRRKKEKAEKYKKNHDATMKLYRL